MTCLVDGCARQAREGWAMCESDITRMLGTAFGPRPIEVEPVQRLSLTELPPTPRGVAQPVDPPPTAAAPLPRQPGPPSTAPAA